VLGINDIMFPGAFTAASERVSADDVIAGNRQLIARAHNKGLQVIMTTIPPFEGAKFTNPVIYFSTPEKEQARLQVNAWIRRSREFEAVADFDAAVRDPEHPARLLPSYDAGDHVHVNDAANVAQAGTIPLDVFDRARRR
jgi:lysophospholipase L1-like esterase